LAVLSLSLAAPGIPAGYEGVEFLFDHLNALNVQLAAPLICNTATRPLKKWATWQMPTLLKPARVCTQRLMSTRDRNPGNPPEAAEVQAMDLYRIEMYQREIGTSEFRYDEQLDVFRFPEDGRFAFCEEFADWERLREREYLLF
jgi:hypothetical protein